MLGRAADGSLRFPWHHIDRVYDDLLACGRKLFVKLNPMPAALAGGPDTMFYYKMNITPPKLWSEWAQHADSICRLRKITFDPLNRYIYTWAEAISRASR